jgi:GNAT superfamily N-acetyltransferase
MDVIHSLPPFETHEPDNPSVVETVVHTSFSNGTAICLRPIRPTDWRALEQGIADLSPESRYLRFFSAFRTAPPNIVSQLVAVDGLNHIGWGAVLNDGADNAPIGAAHAIRLDDDRRAVELAVTVLDRYQGMGLGRLLICTVLIDARRQGYTEAQADILHSNENAVHLLTALGGVPVESEAGLIKYHLDIAKSLDQLHAMPFPAGMRDVFRQLVDDYPDRQISDPDS